jgi:protein CMS1
MSESTNNAKNAPITGGDDLDDDLDLQPDFMAASDGEDDNEQDAIMSNGDEEDLPRPQTNEDAAVFLSEDEEAGSSKRLAKKRKAEEERPVPNVASGSGAGMPLSEVDKKKKRKLKEKERKEKVGQSYHFGHLCLCEQN